MTLSKSPKIKMDGRAAMASHHAASQISAQDRFAVAAQITSKRPTGLSYEGHTNLEPSEGSDHAAQATQQTAQVQGDAFSVAKCQVGQIVSVPLSLIDANPLSPRHTYRSEEVDKIASTLSGGQDVAAHGYVNGQRIQLIDGGTRLRAARITDRGFLDVKIEEAPANELDLFARARALNEQRSPTTALDFALSLRALMDRGAVASQDALAAAVKGPEGEELSKSRVSLYMRISRMPERVQRAMSDYPETASFATLYAVSEIFEAHAQADDQTKAADLEAALRIAEETRRRKLNRSQVTGLVKVYLEGPKARDRSALTPIEMGTSTGQIKVFRKKGQLDLSLKGLHEDELADVKAMLMRALEAYQAGRGVNRPGF